MGLPAEYFRFFSELEHNNNKAWFDEHRDEYHRFVRTPFLEFVGEVIHAIRAVDPEISMEARDTVYRINRDIRFSKDKAPYKLQMGANISRHGKKAMGKPGLYFEVNAKGGLVAVGCYMPDSEELTMYRDLIMHEGSDLHTALSQRPFKTLFGELQGERNKVLPAEFRVAAQKEPLLFNKQFFAWTTVPKKLFMANDAAQQLFEYWKAAQPLNEFLDRPWR